MEVLPGKPQVELETRHQSLYPLLGGQQRHDVVLPEPGALLADEYIVYVDQDHAVQAQAQLPVR